MKIKRNNREGEEEKGKIRIWMVHFNILWTSNQTVIILLKILDIKKLTERTDIINDKKVMGPN